MEISANRLLLDGNMEDKYLAIEIELPKPIKGKKSIILRVAYCDYDYEELFPIFQEIVQRINK